MELYSLLLFCNHFYKDPIYIKMSLDIKTSQLVTINSPITEQPGLLPLCCLIKCEIRCNHDGIFFYFKNRLYLNHRRETGQFLRLLIQSCGQGINPC